MPRNFYSCTIERVARSTANIQVLLKGLQQQSNSITPPEAHTLISLKIKLFESWATRKPRKFTSIVLEATEKLNLKHAFTEDVNHWPKQRNTIKLA